jgi:hypothetical protein
MEKLVHAKNIEELFGAVTVSQRKWQRLLLAKLQEDEERTIPRRPPPAPRAPPGNRP